MMEIVDNVVRELRQNQTPNEMVIWQMLRNRRFLGYKFLRQHALWFQYNGATRFFVADFYCAVLKLVIEVDGGIHEKQRDHDELRTFIINRMGVRVVRIANEETNHVRTLKIRLETIVVK
jgi:very-short-patch-repair endonuclease